MYNRLQTRLNPVPESLNSPDIAPPSSSSLGRARDDPVRVYNRDLAISSSTASTSSSTKSAEASSTISAPKQQQQQQQQQQHHLQQQRLLQKQQSENGYNSSSSDGDQHRGATTQSTKTTTTTTTLSNNKTNQKSAASTTTTTSLSSAVSRIDTGLHPSVGKLRPSSASRSMSLGRKILPANKQVRQNNVKRTHVFIFYETLVPPVSYSYFYDNCKAGFDFFVLSNNVVD
jgi:hypothetical protein